MTDPHRLRDAAETLVRSMLRAGRTLATAESCTGGWVSKAITDIPGSSGCFEYGIVSYGDSAKQALLGVDAATLGRFGAVSEAVVREMAEGALRLSGADFAVAVSGVAGPGGGSAEKPAGTVWFCWASRNGDSAKVDTAGHHLAGDREDVRRQSVLIALAGIQERLETHA